MFWFLLLLLLLLNGLLAVTAGKISPLRIYLLVGQSNMEGKGSIKHLEELLSNDLTKSTFQHYGQPGNYTKRDDVYVYFRDDYVYQGPRRWDMAHHMVETLAPNLNLGGLSAMQTMRETCSSLNVPGEARIWPLTFDRLPVVYRIIHIVIRFGDVVLTRCPRTATTTAE
jgi:hypothetical protein